MIETIQIAKGCKRSNLTAEEHANNCVEMQFFVIPLYYRWFFTWQVVITIC